MANNNKSNYKKLIDTGVPEKCDICGISEWNGEPIKLQVHHKDGNRYNNEINNLQILCPNCHSQTDTFAGRKNKKGECTHVYERPRKHKCSICGKALHRPPKTGMCAECLRKSYKNK